MIPTDGEAAPVPTLGGRADSSAYAAALIHRGLVEPPIYVVRDLYGSLLLRTNDIEEAIVAADSAPAGGYVDHWRPGERPPLGDPLDLGLTIQERAMLAKFGSEFAKRPVDSVRDVLLVAEAHEILGRFPEVVVQESVARCAAMFGRES